MGRNSPRVGPATQSYAPEIRRVLAVLTSSAASVKTGGTPAAPRPTPRVLAYDLCPGRVRRVAFGMFDVPFEEIAPIAGRSPGGPGSSPTGHGGASRGMPELRSGSGSAAGHCRCLPRCGARRRLRGASSNARPPMWCFESTSASQRRRGCSGGARRGRASRRLRPADRPGLRGAPGTRERSRRDHRDLGRSACLRIELRDRAGREDCRDRHPRRPPSSIPNGRGGVGEGMRSRLAPSWSLIVDRGPATARMVSGYCSKRPRPFEAHLGLFRWVKRTSNRKEWLLTDGRVRLVSSLTGD